MVMVLNIPTCCKRIAKGTSSFILDTKIHQRQPWPKSKPINGIQRKHANFHKRIIFIIMCQ